jgi:hypothetical protein
VDSDIDCPRIRFTSDEVLANLRRKGSILRQKAIAGVNGLRARTAGHVENRVTDWVMVAEQIAKVSNMKIW